MAEQLPVLKDTLIHLTTLESPSVRHESISLRLPAWDVHSTLGELNDILSELMPALPAPAVYLSTSPMVPFRPYPVHEARNITSWSSMAVGDSDRSSLLHGAKSLVAGNSAFMFVVGLSDRMSAQATPGSPPNIPFNEEIFYEHIQLTRHKAEGDLIEYCYRWPFALLQLTASGMEFWCYNWSAVLSDRLHKQLVRLYDWSRVRTHMLSAILHQKMGLFDHLPPLPAIGVAQDSEMFQINLGTMDRLMTNPAPHRAPSAVSRREKKEKEKKVVKVKEQSKVDWVDPFKTSRENAHNRRPSHLAVDQTIVPVRQPTPHYAQGGAPKHGKSHPVLAPSMLLPFERVLRHGYPPQISDGQLKDSIMEVDPVLWHGQQARCSDGSQYFLTLISLRK